jgi:nucleoside-triphosphatase THEP1
VQSVDISPASPLARFYMDNHSQRRLYLITGPIGSGKTTWCTEIASRAKAIHLKPGGLISPARFEDGDKVGIDLLNVATDERRHLASLHPEEPCGIIVGGWCFDAATLAWCNQILRSLDEHNPIFLDELGPLEFERRIGFFEGLKLLDDNRYQLAFVVIRPGLIDLACKRWSVSKVIDVTTTAATQFRFTE